MKLSSLTKCILGAVTALSFGFALHAQIVTTGLTGLVRDRGGKNVAGATVTARHVPTGTVSTATTSESGRYNIRGLIAGGPYTVSVNANGFKPSERTDIETQLGV